MSERDLASGLQDAPWPPVYPKMPGEPPRVAPSRAKKPEEAGEEARRKSTGRKFLLAPAVPLVGRRSHPRFAAMVSTTSRADGRRSLAEGISIPLMERRSGWSVASSRSGGAGGAARTWSGARAERGWHRGRSGPRSRTRDGRSGERSMSNRSGSSKCALVEVRRLVQEQNLVAGVERLTAELDVAGDGAVHVLDRRHPAQHLFDRGGEQPEVVQQPFASGAGSPSSCSIPPLVT